MVDYVVSSKKRILYDCRVCGHIMDVPTRKEYINEGRVVRVRKNTGAICCGEEMRALRYEK